VLPIGAAIDELGSAHLSWARPLGFFGDASEALLGHRTAARVVGTLWLAGAAICAVRLALRLRADHRLSGPSATPGDADSLRWKALVGRIPVELADDCPAPAVKGVLHPRITLPRSIDRLLDARELHAVLLHELTHARRRDNLIRLLYEVGLCLLWFHPLVWLAGSRLALYRELSCDESVVRHSRGPELVSALAKLASPESGALLEAAASSFLGRRLAMLSAAPQRPHRAVNAAVATAFAVALAGGLFETVAHTACCFMGR
jgi:beta-lactamase regulating signal transducer with metallopeptidase domain